MQTQVLAEKLQQRWNESDNADCHSFADLGTARAAYAAAEGRFSSIAPLVELAWLIRCISYWSREGGSFEEEINDSVGFAGGRLGDESKYVHKGEFEEAAILADRLKEIGFKFS